MVSQTEDLTIGDSRYCVTAAAIGGLLRGFPRPVARAASWAFEGDLGQRTSTPGRGGLGAPADARPGTTAGDPPFSRGHALPGYSPDFNGDEAVWGWVREEAPGNLCLETKSVAQERVGRFLYGLASRKHEVKRCCWTVLQSRAESLLQHPQPDPRCIANAHPTLALV